MQRLYFLAFLILVNFAKAQKTYQKNYFDDGTIESSGWLENGNKIKYWRYYHTNGNIKSEGHYKNDLKIKYWKTFRANGQKLSQGHYKNGTKADWWIFYDENEKIDHKCQLKNNEKNGYCLMYKNSKLTSAAKYSLGKKIKEWFDFRSFKKENSLSDLK